jgi:purine-binding chemotaxis protein CheW
VPTAADTRSARTSVVHVRLRIGAEVYALPVEHVLEVAELGEVAPVPGSPPEILGVRNLRGQILPIVDLAKVFGVSSSSTAQRLLVAEARGHRAGFAVDEVSDIGTLTGEVEESESELLAGACLAGDELVGIVDIARVFESLEPEGRTA